MLFSFLSTLSIFSFTHENSRQTDFPSACMIISEKDGLGRRKSYSKEKSKCITSLDPFPVEKENGSETVGTCVIKLISTL